MLRLADKCAALGEPPPPSSQEANQLHPLAMEAATCVIRHWRGPTEATPHLAAWLREHVHGAARRSSTPLAWQWNLTCFAWAVHAAAADRPADLRTVQRLGGVMEITARQCPFSAWRDGRPGLPAGTMFPGARASNAATRARLGQCAIAVGPLADAALARLAETGLASATARGDRGGDQTPASAPPLAPQSRDTHGPLPMDVDAGQTREATGRPPGPPLHNHGPEDGTGLPSRAADIRVPRPPEVPLPEPRRATAPTSPRREPPDPADSPPGRTQDGTPRRCSPDAPLARCWLFTPPAVSSPAETLSVRSSPAAGEDDVGGQREAEGRDPAVGRGP